MRDRFNRLLFVMCILGLSWLGMMATHEFGHVVAANVTGGKVVRVVLHPAAISRTDVSPNPAPLTVAWAGPILGCLTPVLLALVIRRLKNHSGGAETEKKHAPEVETPKHDRAVRGQSIAQFFAGFCCIANGAYLGVGVFDRIGDAGEILKAGTPLWVLPAFGLIAFFSGMAMWHRLGSPLAVLQGGIEIDPWLVRGLLATLFLIVLVECIFSPI